MEIEITSIAIRQITLAALASLVAEIYDCMGYYSDSGDRDHPAVGAMIVQMNAVYATLGAAHAIEAAFLILTAIFSVVGAAQMMIQRRHRPSNVFEHGMLIIFVLYGIQSCCRLDPINIQWVICLVYYIILPTYFIHLI